MRNTEKKMSYFVDLILRWHKNNFFKLHGQNFEVSLIVDMFVLSFVSEIGCILNTTINLALGN